MPDLEQPALSDLLHSPREALDIEIKAWLELSDPNQRAVLAKGIIALANHGGGYLVIGLAQQDDGHFVPADGAPANLATLSQDVVQNIIQKYVEPSIQCRVEHIAHPEDGVRYPIVVVPGGHRVPIRAKSGSPDGKLTKDRVYIRRPGPRSEEPQTSAEWDRLFERCLRARKEELVMAIRDVLAGEVPRVAAREPTLPDRLGAFVSSAQNRWAELTKGLGADAPPRFPHGFYESGLAIDGLFEVPSLPDLRVLLQRALRNHSGWPPFLIIDRPPYKPRIVDGAIETWMGPDADGSMSVPSHCDFWRIAPEGLFYTRRGFDEDGRLKSVEPGTAFALTTPIWRIGEIVLQTHYVAVALGAEEANLVARFRWKGISGRQLISIDDRRLSMARTAHPDLYEAEVTMSTATIPTALPEIVFSVLRPLYHLFEFFQLSKRMVEEELAKMMRHQYHQ
jgi:Putative DNA-binding domain